MQEHVDAKEKAKKIFSIMDKEKFVPKSSEALWNVFNGESINYKIKDMALPMAWSILKPMISIAPASPVEGVR